MPSGSFPVDAILKKTITGSIHTFSDDFNRVVGPGTGGLGGPWVWSDDDSNANNAADDNTYVDGAAVILPAHNPTVGGTYNYSSWRWGDRPDAGVLSFDFWVPTLAGQQNSHPTYGVNLDSDTIPVFIYVWPDDSAGNWFVGTSQWDTSSNVPDAAFTPDASSWYTAELVFDAHQNVEMRVWKVGDARPSSPLTSGQMDDVGAPSNNGIPFVDLYYSAVNNEDAKFDNFVLSGIAPNSFTADSFFIQPHFTVDAFFAPRRFTASALIKKTQGGGSATAPVFPSQLPSTGSGSQFVGAAPVSGTVAGDTVIVVISYPALGDTSRQFSALGPDWTRVARAMAPDGSYGLEWWAHSFVTGDSTYLFQATTNNGLSTESASFRVTGAGDVNRFVGGSTVSSALSTTHSTDYIGSLDGLVFLGIAGANNLWTTPSGMTHRTYSADADTSFDTSTATVVGDLGVKTVFSASVQPTVMAWITLPAKDTRTLKAGATVGGRTFSASAVIKRTINNNVAPTVGASTSTGSSSSNTIAASIPSGTVRGDVVVAWIVYDAQGNTPQQYVSNDGWERVAHAMLPNGDEGMDVFVHQVTAATESGTRIFTAAFFIGQSVMGMLRVTGADASRYFIGQKLDITYGTSHSTDYINSNVDGLLLLAAGGANGSTWTPAAGMTERIDTGSTMSFASLEVASQTITTSDIGVKTVLSANSNPDLLVWLVFPPVSATYFRVDAVRLVRHLTADAVLRKTITKTTLTANAVIKKGRTGSFTVDATWVKAFFRVFAVIRATDRTGSFPANAVKRKGFTGSFTADASWAFLGSGSFTANSTVKAAGTGGSFTVDYMTWSGVGPPPPILGVPTKIFVNGIEITSHVIWKTATFSAKVNAQTGECSFDVLDRAHDLTFETGDEVTLYIDGVLRWGGWVLLVNRQFPFPVMKSPTTEPRIFHITGADYNRFLDRRILHDSAHPGRTWDYAAGTNDNTIFNDLWQYFDTTGFTKNIHHVGDGVLDIRGVTARTGGNVAQGGFSMRDVLLHLTWDTGAIFYVTPDKVVTYVDADLVSNPYTLTDTPSGPLDVGFHDVRITEDSTEMVNDAIVWGAGKGSNQVVESRRQSAASQAEHGRWQSGNFTQGIYKQATANAVAQAAIDGSPVSLRGAKNPKRAVELLTWSPVFSVGDVVNFHDSQFFLPPAQPGDPDTHDDVLPIRTMTITWPTPYYPLYALQLSWEVDAVWSFFDPWLPVGAPGLGGGGTGPGGLPPGGQDPPPGCAGCGVTDAFEGRTTVPYDGSYYTGNNWGVSDMGTLWNGSAVASWVDGGAGHLEIYNPPFPPPVPGFDYVWSQQAYLNWGFESSPLDITVELQLSRALAPDDTGHPSDPDYWGDYFWMFFGDGPPYGAGKFVVEFTGAHGAQLVLWDGTGESGFVSTGGLSMTSPFKIRVVTTGPDQPIDVYWWNTSGSQPTTPQISMPTVGTGQGFSNHGFTIELATNNDALASVLRLDMLSLDAIGVTRCGSTQFDNFQRSYTHGWGAATPSGALWLTDATNPNAYLVTPGYGQYNPALSSGFDGLIYTHGVPAFTGIEMLARFSVNNTSGDNEAEPQFYIANADPLDPGDFDDYHGPDIFFFESDPISFSMVQRGANHPGDVDYLELAGPWLGVVWNLHWTINGGRVQASMWRVGEGEPADWMIQGGDENYVFAVPQDSFYFFDPNVGQTVRIYSLDFVGYPGRPCYYICGPSTPVIFDSFLDRTLTNSLGVTSSDGRPWVTTINTGLTDYGVSYVGFPDGAFVRNNGASIAGQFQAKVNPRPGDPWTSGGYFHFQITVRTANVPGTRFFLELDGVSCQIRWEVYMTNSGGLFDVDDPGNGWNASQAKTDWVNNTNYVLEGYADERRGAGVRVYEEGDTPGGWTEFTYDDGSVVGMDGTCTLAVSPFVVPSPELVFWKNLTFLSGCVGVIESVDESVPSGTHKSDRLTPLSTPSGGSYPVNSHWQATNSILPGSVTLTFNGIIQLGNWIEYDDANGIIQVSPTVPTTTAVAIIYITNGALP